jgi:hypothetical protein
MPIHPLLARTHRRARTAAVLAVATAALGLAACGDDAKDDPTSDAAGGARPEEVTAGTGGGAPDVTTGDGAPGVTAGDGAPGVTAGDGGGSVDGKEGVCEAFVRFAMRPADAGGNGLGTLVQDLAAVEPPAELAGAWAVLTAPGIDDASTSDPEVAGALDTVSQYADRECPVPEAPGGP